MLLLSFQTFNILSLLNLKASLYYNPVMKTIIFAFILSITIHILFLYNYKVQKKQENFIQENRLKPNSNKSSLTFVRLKKSKPIQSQQKPKTIDSTNKTEQKQQKEYTKVNKKILPQKKRTKKVIPITKEKEKKVVEKKQQLKKVDKQIQEQQKRSVKSDPLENFLLSNQVLDKELLDNETKSYIKLYGKEYDKFTKVQKEFLQNNLKSIGRITQNYLYKRGYPRIAVRTKQEGMNVIEFYLYPNGDISDMKIINSSSYSTLDKNTKETVETAYKDYPRPKEKTKIRIYVNYKILY
ncbi:hypothetical protein CPU12_00745 [Malaciobacter molluscorum LMG 25693]|uniref:TonB C-terminal domain-containing protein n=2 Tax=Malaciobacter molluscorum LMG 25693 TaxID=870501 RepID=A0A2G1DLF8_9BACT|nr:hypothetical protein CPU12_00745 [Malaciobacter molluscorum LMG 25693]